MKKLKIGNVELENNLILAPMAGVTDLPYRLICRSMGCGMVVTEMVSAKAILYKNKNTKTLLEVLPQERPAAVQLFGSDPDILGEIAAQIEDGPYDMIDFNMGCPVPKIVGNGEGSALMREPKKVEQILSSMVRHVKKPVTVKFRKGFNDTSVNAVEIAKIAESCGVAAVAVHGRTREQYYSGKADWEIIRQVKEAVDPGDWKRRCIPAGRCRGHAQADRLRRRDDRPGSKGKSLDLFQNTALSGNWRNSARAFCGRNPGYDPASWQPSVPVQRGKDGNAGDAQAYGMVHGRTSSFCSPAQ